ncbi:SDR family oxidoreductase [Pseudomonas sp. Pseusp122]|uniref:SDR family oxidoreductase n=1 Tax=unclassified Pseudomonas TaxID=196821 RepID=UPI0039A66F88
MRIFVTGSTGFVGSQVALELIRGGHQVLGLTRSDQGAEALVAIGAEAFRGDIEDLASLQHGAEQCDGVIHTAFDHDFAHFVENCQKDRRAILALGAALEGSDRPLLITSGTPMGSSVPGQMATEDQFNPAHPHPRAASELAGFELTQRGINVTVMRLAQIHDRVKQGLVSYVIELARRTGVSAYVDEGSNNWSAAHISDTARLYRLALEKNQPGARYHAVAEERIAFRQIAVTIGHNLGLPVVSTPAAQAEEHFGWLAGFVGRDMSASSVLTREQLGWQPNGPSLLADLSALAQ